MNTNKKPTVEVKRTENPDTKECVQEITVKDGDKTTVIKQYGKNCQCIDHVHTLNL